MLSEHTYNSWKPKQFAKYEFLSKQIDLSFLSSAHVLDIASGPCWFEEFLQSKDVDISNFIALDISKKHLQERTICIPALLADANFVPLKNKYDAIIALDCLHIFDFPFEKYLKKNGIAIASLFFGNAPPETKLKNKLKPLKIEKTFTFHNKENEIFAVGKNI